MASTPLIAGSGVSITAEDIPSALWPTFIKLSEDITLPKEAGEKRIRKGTRATLLRAEGENLVIDFGRNGVAKITAYKTDYYTQVSELMLGKEEKEFPNFSLQVGNKLMTFGRGDESGPIRFEEAQGTELYVLLYLDTYTPDIAQELMDFGLAYDDLKSNWPNIEVVLMPTDKEFYNFGFTVGYSVPFIATHMRLGYIQSLSHEVEETPGFVAIDPNGRSMGSSVTPIEWDMLAKELERLLNELDINWTAPRISHRSAGQRTASWRN